jgi:hypothetical protein
VRLCRLRIGLVQQGQPLVHAEAVLLVHDRQAEAAEAHALLHQGVGADHQRGAIPYCVQRRLPGLAGHLAAEPGGLDAQRRQPLAEVPQMLFGQQLGGRHDRGLVAIADRAQRRHCGHHGLAGAHVTLQQPLHRVGLRHVLLDFTDHAGLGGRQT